MDMKTLRIHILAASLFAALFSVSCTKTWTETGRTDIHQAGMAMKFSTEAAAMPDSKAVIESDRFSSAGSRIIIYDKLAVSGNPEYDIYIDGQTAGYMPAVAQDGTVTDWNFLDENGNAVEKYWTRSGTHSFTAFTSGYSYPAYGETFTASAEKRGLPFNGQVESDSADPNAAKYEDGLNYNPRHGYLVIKNWTVDMDNQFDFMYAHHTRDLDDPDDLNPYREVPLQMKHLLCAVKFNITNLVPYEETSSQKGPRKILRSFSLPAGIRSTASALITPDAADIVLDNDIQSGYIRDFGQDYSLGYGEANTANIFSEEGNIGTDGFILLWPQPVSGLSAALEYTDRTEKHEWSWSSFGYEWVTYDTEHTSAIPLATNSFTSWQAGRKYIYNIYIQDNRISFTVQVVDWIYDDVTIEG